MNFIFDYPLLVNLVSCNEDSIANSIVKVNYKITLNEIIFDKLGVLDRSKSVNITIPFRLLYVLGSSNADNNPLTNIGVDIPFNITSTAQPNVKGNFILLNLPSISSVFILGINSSNNLFSIRSIIEERDNPPVQLAKIISNFPFSHKIRSFAFNGDNITKNIVKVNIKITLIKIKINIIFP